MPLSGLPYIPETITVHLGPPNSSARNVTVPFIDYIKNVASSEIYPTWPENALRANIYAQITFALNRIYTEWYRSRGYDFDITNSTAYDQAYVPNRDIYDNISALADELFNTYVRKQGTVEPYFTQYCNGTTVTCNGLSQWGTVALAESGATPYEILTNYYGDDIDLVRDAPVRPLDQSYPGTPFRIGSSGRDVLLLQIRLNRISADYPAIPKIFPLDGVFGAETDAAVREFQRIFNLSEDGIVGPATWYRINAIYTAVKRLAELNSEGLTFDELGQQFPGPLRYGDTGIPVRIVQYYLAVIGQFYNTVNSPAINGTFDEATQDAVRAFQAASGLTVDGIVGDQTWNAILDAYYGILDSIDNLTLPVKLFPGTLLVQGSRGEYVSVLQEYLSYIADTFSEIPKLPVTGVFGTQTDRAVRAFQELFGLTPDGRVSPLTWNSIAGVYDDLQNGYRKQEGQYPGYALGASEA